MIDAPINIGEAIVSQQTNEEIGSITDVNESIDNSDFFFDFSGES